jgi:hypothetical protein
MRQGSQGLQTDAAVFAALGLAATLIAPMLARRLDQSLGLTRLRLRREQREY